MVGTSGKGFNVWTGDITEYGPEEAWLIRQLLDS